jgi:hypothetical protein
MGGAGKDNFPKLNFYNFGKVREKTIDNVEHLWHNTDVADTDG